MRPLRRTRRRWVDRIVTSLWGEGGIKGFVRETGWKETTGET